jgi:hypothetical protein
MGQGLALRCGAPNVRSPSTPGTTSDRIRPTPLVRPGRSDTVELRTAAAPNLAMLVAADCQLRQALGWDGRAALMSSDYNGRIAMKLTRRDLAAAGVFALSPAALSGPAMAATEDEEAVKQAVEALRKAILAQDKAKLETLTAEQLSYSHSDARLEDRPNSSTGS